jgi:hypothetical protein
MANLTRKGFLLFQLMTVAMICSGQEAQTTLETVAQRYGQSLNEIFEYQAKVADLSPAFASVYPVAIVENGQIFVFEPNPANQSFGPVNAFPDTMKIPVGIRAAMPLNFWNNRMACVVSSEVFDTPTGYALILHEYVHCYQWETCELRLKEGMSVYQQAMKKNDYMWELQYPFPYGDAKISGLYAEWMSALAQDQPAAADRARIQLRKMLPPADWEYMTWQEWKEGMARWLENKIRLRLGLPENQGGCRPPFNRVMFYCGGAGFIDHLERATPGLTENIESLYIRMSRLEAGDN